MPNQIEQVNGLWQVSNPTNPDENFADKWNENDTLAGNFFSWHKQATKDFAGYFNGDLDISSVSLAAAMTSETVDKVLPLIEKRGLASPAINLEAELDAIAESASGHKPWVN